MNELVVGVLVFVAFIVGVSEGYKLAERVRSKP